MKSQSNADQDEGLGEPETANAEPPSMDKSASSSTTSSRRTSLRLQELQKKEVLEEKAEERGPSMGKDEEPSPINEGGTMESAPPQETTASGADERRPVAKKKKKGLSSSNSKKQHKNQMEDMDIEPQEEEEDNDDGFDEDEDVDDDEDMMHSITASRNRMRYTENNQYTRMLRVLEGQGEVFEKISILTDLAGLLSMATGIE